MEYKNIRKAMKLWAKALDATTITLDTTVRNLYAIKATCPLENIREFISDDGSYRVASAEQSFIDLMLSNELAVDTDYITVGDCYRPNDEGKSKYHQTEFVKSEYFYHIRNDNHTNKDVLVQILIDYLEHTILPVAVDTFDALAVGSHVTVDNVRSESYGCSSSMVHIHYDIDINGVEVGSYLVRSLGDYIWICGTVLAEPRFSQALESKLAKANVRAIDLNKLDIVDEVMQEGYGYHIAEIKKGVVNEFSKIEEEFAEAVDAHEQGNAIMLLNELSDVVLTIDQFVQAKYNMTIEDVLTMANATRRAFQNGDR